MGTGQGRLTHFIHPRQGVRQPVWWSVDELAGHQVDIPTAGSNCWNVCSRVHSIPGMEWIGQGRGKSLIRHLSGVSHTASEEKT